MRSGRNSLPLILMILLALLPVEKSAAQSDLERAREAQHAGVTAFRDNSLRKAREYFNEALLLGLDSSKLRYNLGVVNYRLGDYREAMDHFQMVALSTKSSQLGFYNLGRCAAKLGDPDEAGRWYAKARAGSDPRIAELAAKALGALHSRVLAGHRFDTGLVLGFDSAVVGLVDQVTSLPTGNSDQFAELSLGWQREMETPFLGEGRWGVNAFLLEYGEETPVNVESLSVSWARDDARSQGRPWGLRLYLSHEWLDGQPYQLRGGSRLEYSHSMRAVLFRHSLALEVIGDQGRPAEGTEGYRLDYSTALIRKLFAGAMLAKIGVQANARAEDVYSPLRYSAELYWRSPHLGAWQYTPGLQWRTSDYPDGRAQERRQRINLRLLTPLDAAEAELDIELLYEKNDSDDARQQYEHVRVGVGLRRRF